MHARTFVRAPLSILAVYGIPPLIQMIAVRSAAQSGCAPILRFLPPVKIIYYLHGQKSQAAVALPEQVSRDPFLGRDYGAVQ